MSDYKEFINKGYIRETDPRIQKEMFTFVFSPSGKEQAQTGYHDDGIMSDAVSIQSRKENPPV